MAEKILYEDRSVKITNSYITISRYYIPLMTSKTILFSELKKITIEDATQVKNKWGINGQFLNNWFNYDETRKNKDKFISFEIKGCRVKPSITPQNVDKAFDALRQHFVEVDRKSVQFQSNRDKETELAQKQVAQMMKQQQEEDPDCTQSRIASKVGKCEDSEQYLAKETNKNEKCVQIQNIE